MVIQFMVKSIVKPVEYIYNVIGVAVNFIIGSQQVYKLFNLTDLIMASSDYLYYFAQGAGSLIWMGRRIAEKA